MRRLDRARSSRRCPRGDRHRICHRAGRPPRPAVLDRRTCAGGAARPRRRQCGGRGRRSGSADHGRQRRALRRRDRSGRHRRAARRRAAISRCSSRCGSPRTVRSANCGRYRRGFRVEAEIEFDHPLIGRQALALDVEPDAFRREIARARTFGFMSDVAKLWSAGYALGASFENTLVVDRRPRAQSGRAALSPTNSCATRCSTRSAIWRSPAQPLLGAYRSVRGGQSSTTRCCRR